MNRDKIMELARTAEDRRTAIADKWMNHPDVKASIKRNSEKMREKAYPHHDLPAKVGAK